MDRLEPLWKQGVNNKVAKLGRDGNPGKEILTTNQETKFGQGLEKQVA